MHEIDADHVGEGQHRQTTVSWRKPVARADVICRPGDLRRIQDHAFWLSGGAGGHEADMALYRWQWSNLFGARVFNEPFTVLPDDDLGSRGTRKASGLFRLFHTQHVWLVHTNC